MRSDDKKMNGTVLTRDIDTGVVRPVSLPALNDLVPFKGAVSDSALGFATSVTLHVVLAAWAIFSGAFSPVETPQPLRISFVEFVPIDVTSAAPNPTVAQEALAVKTAVTRSAERSRPAPQKIAPARLDTPAQGTKPPPVLEDTSAGGSARAGTFEATAAGIDGAARVGPLRVGYESAILSRLERVKRYPQRALQRHLEGEVLLALRLATNGQVVHSTISRTSGHPFFDNEVLKMVERATPFPAAPAGLPTAALDFLVPVAFRLE